MINLQVSFFFAFAAAHKKQSGAVGEGPGLEMLLVCDFASGYVRVPDISGPCPAFLLLPVPSVRCCEGRQVEQSDSCVR